MLHRSNYHSSLIDNENSIIKYDLCHRWRDEYKSILKNKSSFPGLIPTGSKPKLVENLAIEQINQIGIGNFLSEIKVWEDTNIITKKEAYELRKFTNEKTSEKYPLEIIPIARKYLIYIIVRNIFSLFQTYTAPKMDTDQNNGWSHVSIF